MNSSFLLKMETELLSEQEPQLRLNRASYIYSGLTTIGAQALRVALLENFEQSELLNPMGLLVFPLALFSGKISWQAQHNFAQLPFLQSGALITAIGGLLIGRTLMQYDWYESAQYGILVGTSFMASEFIADGIFDTTNYARNVGGV